MIDADFQKELRSRYNPDGSQLRNHQLKMLEMLEYVDKVCRENDIRYWLSSGTLLGAVRHGGFIPWDDDLDIEMYREDFLRFKSVFSETDDYVLQTHHTDRAYFWPFAKVRDRKKLIEEGNLDRSYKYRGVFIDVFCIEKAHRIPCIVFGKLFELLARVRNKVYENKWLLSATIFTHRCLLFLIFLLRPILKYKADCFRNTYGTGFLASRHPEDIGELSLISFEGGGILCPSVSREIPVRYI